MRMDAEALRNSNKVSEVSKSVVSDPKTKSAIDSSKNAIVSAIDSLKELWRNRFKDEDISEISNTKKENNLVSKTASGLPKEELNKITKPNVSERPVNDWMGQASRILTKGGDVLRPRSDDIVSAIRRTPDQLARQTQRSLDRKIRTIEDGPRQIARDIKNTPRQIERELRRVSVNDLVSSANAINARNSRSRVSQREPINFNYSDVAKQNSVQEQLNHSEATVKTAKLLNKSLTKTSDEQVSLSKALVNNITNISTNNSSTKVSNGGGGGNSSLPLWRDVDSILTGSYI